jgi:hypothetical protein
VNAGFREVCLGWSFAPGPADPGPPPVRPEPGPADRFDNGWLDAQAKISRVAGRPARAGGAAAAGVIVLSGGVWLAGIASLWLAASGVLVGSVALAACARSVRAGRRKLAAVIATERRRVETARAAQSGLLAARQREQASSYRAWQRRRAIFESQPAWFPVSLPAGIDRIDVAGGTHAGWSALITTIAAPRLGAGGEVTVLDLTEAAVAAELTRLAQRAGLPPLVWNLPADLARFDLGTGLDVHALADVLAVAAGEAAGADRACGWRGDSVTPDSAADCALLEHVLGVLGPDPAVASVNAALRVLADVGNPHDDMRSGLLTAEQTERLGKLFRRGAAERMVLERAFSLETRLRRLDALGTADPPAPGQLTRLRVVALDRRAGMIGNRMLGTYLVAALTHMLRQAEPGRPWAHTIFLLGADRLSSDVLDRLGHACETSATGLVLAFPSIPPTVRGRLGRGNAAIVFMRLGNGDDARTASELIGSEHRFMLAQLTDTIGMSLTDTWGDTYTTTLGMSDTIGGSLTVASGSGSSRGRGRLRHGFGPFGDFNASSSGDSNHSHSVSESVSLTKGINSGTSWGLSLSRALGANASLGRTAQRSREFLVEADALQGLPPTAVIVSYPSSGGRVVRLADVNPALMNVSDALL